MEKQEAQEMLVNAMGSLFIGVEIEATIAEKIGISREEYNKIIETGAELPECIKEYRRLNLMRQMNEEALIKSELKENQSTLLETTRPSNIRNECIPLMIEAGILSQDGKTPTKNLNSIAEFLISHKQNVKLKSLKDLKLQKSNGKPYSKSAYEKAVNIANTTL
jgi:hypothetical protein